MMKNRNIAGKILPLIFFLAMSGCSGQDSVISEKDIGSGPAMDATGVQKSDDLAEGSISIEIHPPDPTSSDDITALVKGRIVDPSFVWTRNGMTLPEINGPRLSSDNFIRGDVIQVTVSGKKATARKEVFVANSVPRIKAVMFEDPYIHRGIDVRVIPKAEDPDGDIVLFHYNWTLNGEDIFLNGDLLSGDRFRKGDRISVQVTPYDGYDHGPVFQSEDFVIPNAPPFFLTTPPTGFDGGNYVYQSKAVDPDGDKVTYSLLQSPARMTIDQETGRVAWTVGRNDVGAHSIVIAAQDEEGMKALQEYVLHVGFSQQF